jgi:hypothetical protein
MSLLRGAIKVGFGFGFTYVVVWGLVGSLERSYESRCVRVCARSSVAAALVCVPAPLLLIALCSLRPLFALFALFPAGTCSAWKPRRRTLRS